MEQAKAFFRLGELAAGLGYEEHGLDDIGRERTRARVMTYAHTASGWTEYVTCAFAVSYHEPVVVLNEGLHGNLRHWASRLCTQGPNCWHQESDYRYVEEVVVGALGRSATKGSMTGGHFAGGKAGLLFARQPLFMAVRR